MHKSPFFLHFQFFDHTGFLGTETGKPLRIDGLQWIAEAMKADIDVGKWFRDRTSNAFMEFLDVLVSKHAAAPHVPTWVCVRTMPASTIALLGPP
jgi:hypothetical protein